MATEIKKWREITVVSSDKVKKKELFMSIGDHSDDLDAAKDFYNQKGYNVISASKSLFDTFGDKIKA